MSPNNKSCSVLSCKNKSRQGNYAFHSFPKDKEERKSWIIACMNPKITTKNEKFENNFVCGKHFSSDCYPFSGAKYKRLKKGSKPTKYLPSLNKNVYIGNEIVGKVVEFDSVAIEEPVAVQSKLFSPQFENLNLKAPNFRNNEPVEVCLKTIKVNLQIIHSEIEKCVLSSINYDNNSKLLEKQLTRNLLAAKVISTTGHLEENRLCIIQTIQRSIEKLQKGRQEYLNLQYVNYVEDVEALESNKQNDEYVECDVEFEECVVDGKTMYKCFRCENMFIKTELLSDHYILEHTLLKSGFQKANLTYKLSNGSIVSIEDNLERN